MIVVIVWAAAAVFGVVILGFCSYEIRWKLSRLSADAIRLRRLLEQLSAIEAELAASAARLRTVDLSR